MTKKLPHLGFGTGELRGHVAYDAVTYALQTEYRLIDTGAIYGNEAEVGNALASSDITREDIYVITKGAHDAHEHGYEQVTRSFESSLARLALQYIDLYLIHWPSNPQLRQESWRAMEAIYKSGRAKAVGVSNYARHHLEELDRGALQPAINQIEFHPYIFGQQHDTLQATRERNITIVGYAPFAGGQGDDDPAVKHIAQRHNKTTRQILGRWSLQHGVIPLMRSANPKHIIENYKLDDFELNPQDMTVLNNLTGRRLFPDPQQLP